MLNRLLEYNYSAVGIFFFIALLKLSMFFSGQVDSGDYSYSLFSIFSQPTILSALISALVTVLLGILILVNSEHNAKRTDFSFWLVLIFALQMSFFSYFSLTEEHLGLFFFIVSFFFFSRGLTHFEKTQSIIDSFNLALFLAIGTLFTPHVIYILPLFWICRTLLGIISLRSFIASLLGIVLPFVIIDTIIFVFYTDAAQYTHRFILDQLSSGDFIAPLQFNSWEQLSAIGPLFLLIYSIYLTFANAHTMKTVVRKFNNVNLIIIIYIGITILLGIIPAHFGLMLLFVPTAYFYSNFHTSTSPRWQQGFLWILLLSLALSFPPIIKGIFSLYQLAF